MSKSCLKAVSLSLVIVLVLNGVGYCGSFPWKKVIGWVAVVGGAYMIIDGYSLEHKTMPGETFDPVTFKVLSTYTIHYDEYRDQSEGNLGIAALIVGGYSVLSKDCGNPEKVSMGNLNAVNFRLAADHGRMGFFLTKRI